MTDNSEPNTDELEQTQKSRAKQNGSKRKQSFSSDSGIIISERNGIRITKSIYFDGKQKLQILFIIESTRKDTVFVHITDSLPSSPHSWDPVVQPDQESQYWTYEENTLICRRFFEPGETIEVTHELTIRSSSETEFYSLPKVLRVLPDNKDGDESISEDSLQDLTSTQLSSKLESDPQSQEVNNVLTNGSDNQTKHLHLDNNPGLEKNSDHNAKSSEASTIAAMPAYNESSTIGDVVSEAKGYVDAVLVVDDGSTDETAKSASEAGADVVTHDRNRGYGAALKTIFEEARIRDTDHLIILDSDGQHDTSDIPMLVEAQQSSGAEIVIASRFAEDSKTELPRYRWFGISIINLLTNLSMGVIRPQSYINDAQSGFRIYNWEAIDSLASDDRIGDRMGASTDILYHAHRHNYLINEVGTTVSYDVDNPSNHNSLFHGYQLVRNLLRTIERDRPILSLGFPGFISAFGGIGLSYLTFHSSVQTGVFPLELAFLSIFATLMGLFFCFTAILLHSLNTIGLQSN